MSTRMSRAGRWSLVGLVLGGLFAAKAEAASMGTVSSLGSVTRIGGIGADGKIVGGGQIGSDPAAPYHAFVNDNGTITDLGTLGGSSSSAAAINRSGLIVGESFLAGDSEKRAFLYSGGRMSDLGTIGGSYSTATGINAAGDVVGQSTNAAGATHAYVLRNGTMTDLGTLGGTSSSAAGINDAGQIAGHSALANGSTHAFRASGGVLTDLGTLGGSSSFGYGINASGQVVGQAYTTGDLAAHAFVWQNGTMTDLGTLAGFRASVAKAINASGQIVGNSYGKNDPVSGVPIQHAFIYDKGIMRNINDLTPTGSNWVLSEATGINDLGQVIGFGLFNGKRQAYAFPAGDALAQLAAQTVPEPSTLALFGLVIAGFGARAYARRKNADA